MTMSRTRFFGLVAGALALLGSVGAAVASCSQTPVNVPVRTFELAQKVDVICMRVNDAFGNALLGPTPVPEGECAPVPVNANGAALPFHLFAAVTQVARGELAIVDLTAGNVVDEDKSTPGINFIPVGSIPTDVVVAPDAKMTFVSSGDPGKPAIYGMPNVRILGDSMGSPPQPALKITDLFTCALPQPPDALAVAALPSGGYVLVAMLRAWAGAPATIAAIDPTPLIEGAAAQYPGTGIDDGAIDAGVQAGSLGACKVLGAIALSPALPASWTPGPTWPDGVPYVDGGVVLTDAEPSAGPTCSNGSAADAGPTPLPLLFGPLAQAQPTYMAMRTDVPLLYVADGRLPVIHVIDVGDPTAPKEQAPLLATSVSNPALRVAVGQLAISPPTHDYRRYLYAVDTTSGGVMVFDISDPVASPHQPLSRPHPELNPFSPADRLTFAAPVATLAFVQHDWPLPSQDPSQSADPTQQYTGLLCNPNKYARPDGGTFVDRGAYYRADEDSVIQASSTGTTGAVENFPFRLRGIFAFVTLSNGTIVTIDVDDWDAPCRRPDPMTISPTEVDISGNSYSGLTNGMTGSLDVPEPEPSSSSDLDPYHAPLTYNALITESAATTLESFFPVSAPNRVRSNYLLRNDPTSGLHQPNQVGPTLLFDVNGSLVSTNSVGGSAAPLLLPTPLPANFYDPTYLQNPTEPDPTLRTALSTFTPLVGAAEQTGAAGLALMPGSNQTSPPAVRVSFDDPTAQQDQSWSVTYEGALPTVGNLSLDLASADGTYQTLTLGTGIGAPDASAAAPGPAFCSKGIEDWSLGQARAGVVLQALTAAGLPAPGAGAQGNPTLPQWTSDYVELLDDLLPQSDPYWGQPSSQNDCWDDSPLADDPSDTGPSSHADDRFNACAQQYGAEGEDAAPEGNQTVADTFPARDFPIVEAYDDHLVLGRFGWFQQDPNDPATTVNEQPNNRVVVGADPSNAIFLRFARCCFHHQATFKVRSGGEWLTVGSATGLLHHVQTDPGTRRCVLGCNASQVLENARTFDIPWSTTATLCAPPASLPAGLDRNSVLAMRNPMFSFVVWSGCAKLTANDHTETARDLVWKFSLGGGFTPVTVSLSQNTTTAVNPQSMRFIDSLGQLAVVDGAQQGLVLIDLNTLQFAHNPYY
jgi:hypothetical protein